MPDNENTFIKPFIKPFRECFVTVNEMEVATSFKAAINRTFSNEGGVMWEKVNDQQLRCFLMATMRELQANNSIKHVIGSLLIGQQPNLRRVDDFGNFLGPDAVDGELKEDFDNAVYILNENVQV